MTDPLPIECARYEEDWSALLDAELAPERAALLRGHAEGCARCRARLASLARVDVLLAGAPVPEVRAELFAELRARIAAQEDREAARADAPPRLAPPARRRWRARGLVAAAIAAAAAIALYLALPRMPAPIAPEPETRVAGDPEFDALPAEEIAIGLDLDTAKDLEVIANLDLLERLVALEEGRG